MGILPYVKPMISTNLVKEYERGIVKSGPFGDGLGKQVLLKWSKFIAYDYFIYKKSFTIVVVNSKQR